MNPKNSLQYYPLSKSFNNLNQHKTLQPLHFSQKVIHLFILPIKKVDTANPCKQVLESPLPFPKYFFLPILTEFSSQNLRAEIKLAGLNVIYLNRLASAAE